MKVARILFFATAILAGIYFSGHSVAGGSLGFDEVVGNLAGQSPKLMDEVYKLLSKEHLKIRDITCGGVRLGRHWTHLGGLRVPTFSCFIGGQKLTIDGTVYFYDETGGIGEPDSAIYFAMTDPKWSWNTEER